ncbi:hypothetical protein G9A89_008633 [Geosiphon pyriformis]|nr:hypothetical protein G9A89_008633 [Geosiphon pyriformis]
MVFIAFLAFTGYSNNATPILNGNLNNTQVDPTYFFPDIGSITDSFISEVLALDINKNDKAYQSQIFAKTTDGLGSINVDQVQNSPSDPNNDLITIIADDDSSLEIPNDDQFTGINDQFATNTLSSMDSSLPTLENEPDKELGPELPPLGFDINTELETREPVVNSNSFTSNFGDLFRNNWDKEKITVESWSDTAKHIKFNARLANAAYCNNSKVSIRYFDNHNSEAQILFAAFAGVGFELRNFVETKDIAQVQYPFWDDEKLYHQKYYPSGWDKQKVHKGIYNLWRPAQEKFIEKMESMSELNNAIIQLVGHGLGGAYALFAGLAFLSKHEDRKMTIYTFGEPRLGNKHFAGLINNLIKEKRLDVFRGTTPGDPIIHWPNLPNLDFIADSKGQIPSNIRYQHHQKEFMYVSETDRLYECKIPTSGEENKPFSPLKSKILLQILKMNFKSSILLYHLTHRIRGDKCNQQTLFFRIFMVFIAFLAFTGYSNNATPILNGNLNNTQVDPTYFFPDIGSITDSFISEVLALDINKNDKAYQSQIFAKTTDGLGSINVDQVQNSPSDPNNDLITIIADDDSSLEIPNDDQFTGINDQFATNTLSSMDSSLPTLENEPDKELGPELPPLGFDINTELETREPVVNSNSFTSNFGDLFRNNWDKEKITVESWSDTAKHIKFNARLANAAYCNNSKVSIRYFDNHNSEAQILFAAFAGVGFELRNFVETKDIAQVQYPFWDDEKLYHQKYYPSGWDKQKVHKGIYNLWRPAQEKFIEKMESMSELNNAIIQLVGHGLGGAYALFAGLAFLSKHEDRKMTIYTFGEPRLGNKHFAGLINNLIKEKRLDVFRGTTPGDPIIHWPNLPNLDFIADSKGQIPSNIRYQHHQKEFMYVSETDRLYECKIPTSGEENKDCAISEPLGAFEKHSGPYFGIKMGTCQELVKDAGLQETH